jgi:tight adherence protein B
MQTPQLALLVLAGTLLLALVGIALLVASSARRGALADRTALHEPEPFAARLAARVDSRFRRTRAGARLALLLSSAGVGVGPSGFVGLCAIAFLTGYALTALLFPTALAVLAGLSAVGACFAWVKRKRAQRRFEFIAQLPEVARLLANGAQAGLSLAGAVERSARELDQPAAGELAAVVQELRLGRSLDAALQRLRDRLPSREVAVLMSTLVIQQRAGGDTVRALQDLAETLEARKDTLREVRTTMAGAVFTSYIVAVMGVGTIFLMNAMSPGVLDEMTGSLLGIGALVVAAVMYAIGFSAIRRTTRIEL